MPIDIASVTKELQAVVGPALAVSEVIKAGLLAEAKRGESYGKSIAPVSKRPHTLPSGYVNNPGDYRKSIEGTVVFEKGRWIGRVGAQDWKAHWIEYGTVKMPKQAIMRRTAAHLRGTGG